MVSWGKGMVRKVLFWSPCKKLSLKGSLSPQVSRGRGGIKGFLERSVLVLVKEWLVCSRYQMAPGLEEELADALLTSV